MLDDRSCRFCNKYLRVEIYFLVDMNVGADQSRVEEPGIV